MVLLFAALGMCAACGIVVATLGLNSHVLARGTADDAMVWSPMSSPAADPPMRAQLTRPFESVAERISERSERKGNPTLAEGRALTGGKAVMGGVAQRDELIWGPVEAIAGQVKEAEATVGRGLLIAPGCSVPPRVREAHLRAMLEAA
jgi:hypothetical protein